MKKTAIMMALMLVLGIVFVSGYVVAQNQNGAPGKGLIQSNPTGQVTEMVAVANHRAVSTNENEALTTATKENVKNEHVVS